MSIGQASEPAYAFMLPPGPEYRGFMDAGGGRMGQSMPYPALWLHRLIPSPDPQDFFCDAFCFLAIGDLDKSYILLLIKKDSLQQQQQQQKDEAPPSPGNLQKFILFGGKKFYITCLFKT